MKIIYLLMLLLFSGSLISLFIGLIVLIKNKNKTGKKIMLISAIVFVISLLIGVYTAIEAISNCGHSGKF